MRSIRSKAPTRCCVLTTDELYAVRDPRGFRPLVLGRLPATETAAEAWMVASETCAFDLLNAQYIREVEPGEMVRISQIRHRVHPLCAAQAATALRFRTCLFFAPGQHYFRPLGEREPRSSRPLARARTSRRRRHRRAGARLRRSRCCGLRARIENSLSAWG